MTDNQETPDAEDTAPSGSATLPPLRPPCERLSCHKSSVCSRSYFVVVMVFFHVYIINVIALLFYVHYSSGQEDANRSRDTPSGNHQRPESGRPPSKPEFLRDVSLTRIEGIRVSLMMYAPLPLFDLLPLSLSLSLPDTLSSIKSLLWLMFSGGTCPEGVTGARQSAWNAHSESETFAVW